MQIDMIDPEDIYDIVDNIADLTMEDVKRHLSIRSLTLLSCSWLKTMTCFSEPSSQDTEDATQDNTAGERRNVATSEDEALEPLETIDNVEKYEVEAMEAVSAAARAVSGIP